MTNNPFISRKADLEAKLKETGNPATSWTTDSSSARTNKFARDLADFFALGEGARALQNLEKKLRNAPTYEQLRDAKEQEKAQLIAKLYQQMYSTDPPPSEADAIAASNAYNAAITAMNKAQNTLEMEKSKARNHSERLASTSFNADRKMLKKMESKRTSKARNDMNKAETAVNQAADLYKDKATEYSNRMAEYNNNNAKKQALYQQAINDLTAIDYSDEMTAETKTNKEILDRYEIKV